MSKAGPSNRGKKRRDIDPVLLRDYIENCIKRDKSKIDTVDFLTSTYNVDATEALDIWEEVEFHKNVDKVFKAEEQITVMLKLLEIQMALLGRSDEKPIMMVHRYIEFCIKYGMSKDETIEFLATNCKTDEASTRAEWDRLKHENPEIFKNYYEKLEIRNRMEMEDRLDNEASPPPISNRGGDAGPSSSRSNNDDEDEEDEDEPYVP